jgi:hypothetical protein
MAAKCGGRRYKIYLRNTKTIPDRSFLDSSVVWSVGLLLRSTTECLVFSIVVILFCNSFFWLGRMYGGVVLMLKGVDNHQPASGNSQLLLGGYFLFVLDNVSMPRTSRLCHKLKSLGMLQLRQGFLGTITRLVPT